MVREPVKVRVFAAPDTSCDHGMTWSGASAMIAERLRRRFDGGVELEHIEIFSPRSFEFPEIMATLEAGGQLPIVTVGDRIVSQGGKLFDRVIRQAVEALLPPERGT